jgi:hypothetical protein
MKKITIAVTILFLVPVAVLAQGTAPATVQKSLSATMNVYVFPTTGQDAAQQSTDEAACYTWAVQNTGTDPFELAKSDEQAQQAAEQKKQAAAAQGQGAGAKGAVRGAAAGALIGEIADDDPGKGAAYGAAAGMIASRRRSGARQKEATQSADAQVQQTKQVNAEAAGNFKKAFSVCLEAKSYMVKY